MILPRSFTAVPHLGFLSGRRFHQQIIKMRRYIRSNISRYHLYSELKKHWLEDLWTDAMHMKIMRLLDGKGGQVGNRSRGYASHL